MRKIGLLKNVMILCLCRFSGFDFGSSTIKKLHNSSGGNYYKNGAQHHRHHYRKPLLGNEPEKFHHSYAGRYEEKSKITDKKIADFFNPTEFDNLKSQG